MISYLVSISCITYNHAPYIRQCLDGFLMQQCNFGFEVLIHDDASNDGTQEIIREYQQKYPDIIRPIYQSQNQWSQGVRGIMARFNFPRAQGKYIALCEGDDYWTDPLKLQKQVDFLEKHPEYSLVSGGFKSVNAVTGEEIVSVRNVEDTLDNTEQGFDITLERFFKQWLTKTLTLTFRKDMYNPDVFKKYKYVRDVHLYYHLLKDGKGYYMKEIFGVYHIHQGGIFSLIDNRQKQRIHFFIFQEIYKNNKDKYTRVQYRKGLVNAIKNPFEKIEIKQNKTQLFINLFLLTRNRKELKQVLKLLYSYTVLKRIVSHSNPYYK